MSLWKCEVCGYVAEGAEAPKKCPKCGELMQKRNGKFVYQLSDRLPYGQGVMPFNRNK